MRTMILTAACFCLGVSAAAAEPAGADPSFLPNATQVRATPHLIATVPVMGTPFSLVATGRNAAIDTVSASDDLEESMEMRGFLPGYPQPAHVTFDVRFSF